jgi:signal transduction histidine kinase
LKIAVANLPKENRLEITIADTGSGIAPDDLPKIFNPFFTTKDKGIGLGLALVKKIIAAHYGTIEVISKLSEGTTFVISLPISSPGQAQNLAGLSDIPEKATFSTIG